MLLVSESKSKYKKSSIIAQYNQYTVLKKSSIENKMLFSNDSKKVLTPVKRQTKIVTPQERIQELISRGKQPTLIVKGLAKVGMYAERKTFELLDEINVSNFNLIKGYLYILSVVCIWYFILVLLSDETKITVPIKEIDTFINVFVSQNIWGQCKLLYQTIDVLTCALFVYALMNATLGFELFFFTKIFLWFGELIIRQLQNQEYCFDKNWLEVRRFLNPHEIDEKIQHIVDSISKVAETKNYVFSHLSPHMEEIDGWYKLGSKLADPQVHNLICEKVNEYKALVAKAAEEAQAALQSNPPTSRDELIIVVLCVLMGLLTALFSK